MYPLILHPTKKNSRVDSIYILNDEDQVKLIVPSNKEN